MEQNKFNELIMHLLVNLKTEVFTLKDIILADIMARNGHATLQEQKTFKDVYETMRKEYQNEIIAQIRSRYDDRLGNIDDLLNNILKD